MPSLIDDGDNSGATLPGRVDGVSALRYDSAVFDHGSLMRRRDLRCSWRAEKARRRHMCGGRRAGTGSGTDIGDTDAPRWRAGRD
jgi:hypothetical protein